MFIRVLHPALPIHAVIINAWRPWFVGVVAVGGVVALGAIDPNFVIARVEFAGRASPASAAVAAAAWRDRSHGVSGVIVGTGGC